jgi:hypothetical protein
MLPPQKSHHPSRRKPIPGGRLCLNSAEHAFSQSDLLASMAGLALLGILLLPALAGISSDSKTVYCLNNLRQIDNAWRAWASDHRDRFPWQVEAGEGGTRYNGNSWQHFAAASNELRTPRVLVCPSDTRKKPASHFGNSIDGLGHNSRRDNAVSYFVGLDVMINSPGEVLTGDRHLAGLMPNRPCIWLFSNVASEVPQQLESLQWVNGVHGANIGNVALADGSVRTTSNSSFRSLFNKPGETDANRVFHFLIQFFHPDWQQP